MVVADLQALAQGCRPTVMQYLTPENRASLLQGGALHQDQDLDGSTGAPTGTNTAEASGIEGSAAP